MSKKKIQEEFQKDPKAFYEEHKTIIDSVVTKLSMEERSYLRIETPGAEGVLGDFLRLIAAWQRIPPGTPSEKKPPEKKEPPLLEEKKPREKKKVEEMTLEELEEGAEEFFEE